MTLTSRRASRQPEQQRRGHARPPCKVYQPQAEQQHAERHRRGYDEVKNRRGCRVYFHPTAHYNLDDYRLVKVDSQGLPAPAAYPPPQWGGAEPLRQVFKQGNEKHRAGKSDCDFVGEPVKPPAQQGGVGQRPDGGCLVARYPESRVPVEQHRPEEQSRQQGQHPGILLYPPDVVPDQNPEEEAGIHPHEIESAYGQRDCHTRQGRHHRRPEHASAEVIQHEA